MFKTLAALGLVAFLIYNGKATAASVVDAGVSSGVTWDPTTGVFVPPPSPTTLQANVDRYDYNHNGIVDASDISYLNLLNAGITDSRLPFPCPADRRCSVNTLDFLNATKILAGKTI